MHIPKAHKLPSGSWTCRVRIKKNGKLTDHSFTRQTKKEAIAEAMAYKAGIKDIRSQSDNSLKTVSEAEEDYISERMNVCSPSTIRGYRTYQKHRFKSAQNLLIWEVTDAKWQRIVNDEALLCAPKTLKNAWSFLKGVIKKETGKQVSVRLPQVPPKDKPFLTSEQVPVFVEAIKGESFEIPALLALSGLRRSEILALQWSAVDMDKGIIHVAGAAVLNSENKLTQKETNKNISSTRIVPIIPPLKDAIKRYCQNHLKIDSGLIVTTAPNTLCAQINRKCKKLGFPKVGVHGLRRTFASLAYHLGMPEEVTMRIGGWSDIYTMRKIYTYISDNDMAEQIAVLSAFFEQFGTDNANEKDNKH